MPETPKKRKAEVRDGGGPRREPANAGTLLARASTAAAGVSSNAGQREKTDAATSDVSKFLRSWAWKREHRPDRDRFVRPYKHPMSLHASLPISSSSSGSACGTAPKGQASAPPPPPNTELTIHQAKFAAEGFASTVWDSAIVVAKWAEKHAGRLHGRRALDLSAGCGLVGVALCKLGAITTATDLSPNLPLLHKNAEANGVELRVLAHTWGEEMSAWCPAPFDFIFACDVMYVREAVPDLIATLRMASGPDTEVYLAHGRNRFAEEVFMAAAREHFSIEELPSDELHDVYQCSDVSVYRLKRV